MKITGSLILGLHPEGLLPEAQGQTVHPHEQVSQSAGELALQKQDILGQSRLTQPQEMPLSGAELHHQLHAGKLTPLP